MNILLVLYAALVLALIVAEYKGDARAQWLFKPACALGFILIALQSGALETVYGQIILAGLVFCAIGDVLLLKRGAEKTFLLGMAAFALGHVLFVVAFYFFRTAMAVPTFDEFVSAGAIGVGVAGVVGFAATHICKQATPSMRAPIAIYAAMIWGMTIFAIFTQNPMIIAGAILFTVSDFFVGRDRFIAQKPWHALAITPLYFGAQALFALSVARAL